MMFGKQDDRGPLDRALDAAAGYRVGSWESVRALTWLVRARRELRL